VQHDSCHRDIIEAGTPPASQVKSITEEANCRPNDGKRYRWIDELMHGAANQGSLTAHEAASPVACRLVRLLHAILGPDARLLLMRDRRPRAERTRGTGAATARCRPRERHACRSASRPAGQCRRPRRPPQAARAPRCRRRACQAGLAAAGLGAGRQPSCCSSRWRSCRPSAPHLPAVSQAGFHKRRELQGSAAEASSSATGQSAH